MVQEPPNNTRALRRRGHALRWCGVVGAQCRKPRNALRQLAQSKKDPFLFFFLAPCRTRSRSPLPSAGWRATRPHRAGGPCDDHRVRRARPGRRCHPQDAQCAGVSVSNAKTACAAMDGDAVERAGAAASLATHVLRWPRRPRSRCCCVSPFVRRAAQRSSCTRPPARRATPTRRTRTCAWAGRGACARDAPSRRKLLAPHARVDTPLPFGPLHVCDPIFRGLEPEAGERCGKYAQATRPSVAELTAQAPQMARCVPLRPPWGESKDDDNNECRDDLRVAHCAGALPGAAAEGAPEAAPSALPSVHICSPVLRGDIDAAWLRAFFGWYVRLGVSNFTLYALRANVTWQVDDVAGASVQWVVVEWIPSYEMWSMGQIWVVHDCAFRARAAGARWTLFVDVDELLTFGEDLLPGKALDVSARRLPRLAADLDASGFVAAFIGSVPYLATHCASDAAEAVGSDDAAAAPLRLAERITYRAARAECWDLLHEPFPSLPPELCPALRGRRKALARVGGADAAMQFGVHTVQDVPQNRSAMLNASLMWLKHPRGVGSRPHGDLCGAGAGCAPLHTGAAIAGDPPAYRCELAAGVLEVKVFLHEALLAAAGEPVAAAMAAAAVAAAAKCVPSALRCDTSGEAGLGGELEHFLYCVFVALNDC